MGEHHELRFDAADDRAFHHGLQGGGKQQVLAIRGTHVTADVEIADQALILFEDVVNVAGHFAVFDEGAAAKRTHLDKAADQVGGFVEVPFEFTAPGEALLLEQGIQVPGGEAPQVDNLANWLGSRMEPGCHKGVLL